MEFTAKQATDNMRLVPGGFRLGRFYDAWRSVPDGVLIYQQRKPVDYADYKVGMMYVSAADLADGWQCEDEL